MVVGRGGVGCLVTNRMCCKYVGCFFLARDVVVCEPFVDDDESMHWKLAKCSLYIRVGGYVFAYACLSADCGSAWGAV
jgi:hypothetical protein